MGNFAENLNLGNRFWPPLHLLLDQLVRHVLRVPEKNGPQQTRGGTHMLRQTGMCRPNGLLFHQKSSDMGPTLVNKILKGGSHFTKLAKKL